MKKQTGTSAGRSWSIHASDVNLWDKVIGRNKAVENKWVENQSNQESISLIGLLIQMLSWLANCAIRYYKHCMNVSTEADIITTIQIHHTLFDVRLFLRFVVT